MKKILNNIIFFLLLPLVAFAKDYSVTSPSGELKMYISVEGTTSYTLVVKGQTVLENCRIAMELEDGTVLGNGEIRKDTRGSRVENIAALNYRQKEFTSVYNYLSLRFEGNYTLQVRAYDDGVAYRFVTSFPDDITVMEETVQFNFSDTYQMYIPLANKAEDRFRTSFERPYELRPTLDAQRSDKLGFLPILVKSPDFGNLLLMESDVEDYPGMFVTQTKAGLQSVFPPVPESFSEPDQRGTCQVANYHNYIAKTTGSRTFPWRIIAYAEKEFGEKLALKDYYMGLSDMSYTGLSEEANHEALFNNLAGANITYSFPMQALKALHVPGIVLGGWGKDFHQSTERLNVPYSFGVVPALYIRIIDYIFNK